MIRFYNFSVFVGGSCTDDCQVSFAQFRFKNARYPIVPLFGVEQRMYFINEQDSLVHFSKFFYQVL